MENSSKNLHILMIVPQLFFSTRGTLFSLLHRIGALLSQGYSIDLLTYGDVEPFESPPSKGKLRVLRRSLLN